MMPLEPNVTWLYITLIIATGYYIRGIAGYGSGPLAIPGLALFLPLEVVVPMVGALDLLAAIVHGTHHHKQVQWKELARILPLSTLGMLLGMYLFTQLDREGLKFYLGLFVILYALYAILPLPQMQGTRWWSFPLVSTGGLVDTLFGTGGPFYVIYLRLSQLSKSEFVATLAMGLMFSTGLRLTGYTIAGFYTTQILAMIGLALPLVIAGMYLGMHTHNRLSAQQFAYIISALLIAAGIILIGR